MARRTFQLALAEILDEIAWIQQQVAGKDFDHFVADRQLRYAVERSIEIISEASRRIPDAVKATQPAINWKAIAGVGNVMRHDYHAISPTIIWNALDVELPPLKAAVKAIAAALPPETAE